MGVVVSGWQPIETAPEDGTEFLAYYPEGKIDDDYENWIPVVAIVKTDERCDLDRLEGNTYFMTPYGNPTHWMPLPPPPEA